MAAQPSSGAGPASSATPLPFPGASHQGPAASANSSFTTGSLPSGAAVATIPVIPGQNIQVVPGQSIQVLPGQLPNGSFPLGNDATAAQIAAAQAQISAAAAANAAAAGGTATGAPARPAAAPLPPLTLQAPSPAARPAGQTAITTEQIQQYLEDNETLIKAILENANAEKFALCNTYQARLQQNLMYLAAIADAQPQPPVPGAAPPAAAPPAMPAAIAPPHPYSVPPPNTLPQPHT